MKLKIKVDDLPNYVARQRLKEEMKRCDLVDMDKKIADMQSKNKELQHQINKQNWSLLRVTKPRSRARSRAGALLGDNEDYSGGIEVTQ